MIQRLGEELKLTIPASLADWPAVMKWLGAAGVCPKAVRTAQRIEGANYGIGWG